MITYFFVYTEIQQRLSSVGTVFTAPSEETERQKARSGGWG